MKTLAFGEVLWDVYPTSKHLGGAPMNFAAHFKACGGEASIVTAVGDDEYGKEALVEIERLGVDSEYVTVIEKKETGKCLVTLDENKIPSYNLLRDVAYDYIKKPALKNDSCDVLYFGTLALRGENNLRTLNEIILECDFAEVFVDINIRAPYYNAENVRFALKNATILKISEEELPVVMDTLGMPSCSDTECAERLNRSFEKIKIVVITKGERGSFAYDTAERKFYKIDAKRVPVVSTVGAGDSFSAAFLAEYLKTKDIAAALSLATKISAFVVSQADAMPEYKLSDFEQNQMS